MKVLYMYMHIHTYMCRHTSNDTVVMIEYIQYHIYITAFFFFPYMGKVDILTKGAINTISPKSANYEEFPVNPET